MSESIQSASAAGETPEDAVTRLQVPGIVHDITGVRPSPSSTYRLMRTGKIPAFRLVDGGQLYARRADVEAYARQQLAAGMSPRGREAAAAVARIKGHRIRKAGGR